MTLSHSVPGMCQEPGLPHFLGLLLAAAGRGMALCCSPNPIYRTPYPTAGACPSACAGSSPCPEPRHRQGPRSHKPRGLLSPCAAFLSPQKRWQVPGSCVSPDPGLFPCGLALPSAPPLPFLPSPSSPPGLTPSAQDLSTQVRSDSDSRSFSCCESVNSFVWS